MESNKTPELLEKFVTFGSIRWFYIYRLCQSLVTLTVGKIWDPLLYAFLT